MIIGPRNRTISELETKYRPGAVFCFRSIPGKLIIISAENARIYKKIMAKNGSKIGIGRKYGYLWVTLIFFLFSVAGHWISAWYVYETEQADHNSPVDLGDYALQTFRDTMENWQSEFLQLIWQIAGLAYLLYIGSPQSKEGDERKEEKIDFLINSMDPKRGPEFIKKLKEKYPQK
jgi:hypothetical protein